MLYPLSYGGSGDRRDYRNRLCIPAIREPPGS